MRCSSKTARRSWSAPARVALALLAVFLVAGGCGSGGSTTTQQEFYYQAIGPAGGTASAGPVVLTIPPGAYVNVIALMYPPRVKRLQIMIDEDLDESLERQARDEGSSKAALIRRYVRERLLPLGPIEMDPLWDLVGQVEGVADDSARIDDIVYAPQHGR